MGTGASLAAEVPYDKAKELFKELTGLSMSDHTMHEVVGNICERMKTKNAEEKREIDSLIGYLKENMDRVGYKFYRNLYPPLKSHSLSPFSSSYFLFELFKQVKRKL